MAYAMLCKFDSLYLKKFTALQIVNRHRLESVKLDEKEDPSKFFNEFERAVNDLKAAGATVTENEKLTYMIQALPESYAYYGNFIDISSASKKSVAYFKSKILVKSKTNGASSSENGVNSQMFAARAGGRRSRQKFNYACYKCSKEGHRRFECPELNKKESNRANVIPIIALRAAAQEV